LLKIEVGVCHIAALVTANLLVRLYNNRQFKGARVRVGS